MPTLKDLLSGNELSALGVNAADQRDAKGGDARAAARVPAQDPAETANRPLKETPKGENFDGVLLVRSSEVRTSSNGSKYLDATLADRSGEVNGKAWDWGENPPPEPGTAVRVRVQMTEYNGRPQLRIDRIAKAEEGFDWHALVPTAPEPAEAMYAEMIACAESFADEDLRKLTLHLLGEHREQLLYYPAALSYHHSERSGLLHHTTGMLRGAAGILPVYPFLNADLLRAGVLLHDIGKLSELTVGSYGLAEEYSAQGALLGHIVIGICWIREAGLKLGVDGETLMALEHMLISHHGTKEFGSPMPPMMPEAEVLHHLDVIDARMYDMSTALASAPEGGFSERVRSLEGRKLYKPKGTKDGGTQP